MLPVALPVLLELWGGVVICLPCWRHGHQARVYPPDSANSRGCYSSPVLVTPVYQQLYSRHAVIPIYHYRYLSSPSLLLLFSSSPSLLLLFFSSLLFSSSPPSPLLFSSNYPERVASPPPIVNCGVRVNSKYPTTYSRWWDISCSLTHSLFYGSDDPQLLGGGFCYFPVDGWI